MPRLKNKTKSLPIPYQLAYMPAINRIAVKADERLWLSLRSFEGMNEHQSDSGRWFSVPATRSNILCLECLSTPESVGKEYIQFRNELMDIPIEWANGAESFCKIQRQLMIHQRQFIELAHDKVGMFNGSEQGTGKTTPAFILSRSLGATKVIVLCPKTLPNQWMKEQRKLWGHNVPFEIVDLVDGLIKDRKQLATEALLEAKVGGKKGTLVFINYEVLPDMLEYLTAWNPHILWIDESWRCKNPTAKTTIAAMVLSPYCSQRFLMSGTIIGNHVGDLWSQIMIINPDILCGMTYNQFMERFAIFKPINTAGGARTIPVGISDPVGLMRLLEPIWYRAVKSVCMDLPPKQHEIVLLPLHPETDKLYKAVKKDGLAALGCDLSLEGQRVIKLRLHQIAGGFKPVPTDEINGTTGANMWKLEPLPSSKLEWLIEWAKDRIDDNSEIRCIVWVRFNAEGERIKTELEKVYGKGKAVFIWNDTKNDQIEEWEESFNSRNPDGVKFLVCQIQKMCAGYNLQAADHHVFYSNPYSYIYRSQAEERSDRPGREGREAVTIWDIVAQSTIDEEIYDCLQRKRNMATLLTPSTCSDTIGETVEEE